MMCSSYSSGSGEVSKDEHVNVDEVSDSPIVNQDSPLKKEVSAPAKPNSTNQRDRLQVVEELFSGTLARCFSCWHVHFFVSIFLASLYRQGYMCVDGSLDFRGKQQVRIIKLKKSAYQSHSSY